MFRRFIGVAVAGAAALMVVTAPAEAADNPISDAEYTAIIKEVWRTGTVSDEQRAKILSRPELAEDTVDPTTGTPDYELPGYVPDPLERAPMTKPPTGPDNFPMYATRTTSRDRYVVYETFWHSKIVNYHFRVAWSYNGTSVVGTPARSTWIDAAAPGIYNRGIISDGSYRNYNGSRLYAWTLPLQGQWEQCVGGACGQQVGNPYVIFGVYFDGTYHYTFKHK